jgi:hypothetical protein
MTTFISGSTGIDKIQNNAVDIADLSATGTASASTFLRGDNAWTDALPTQSGNAGKFLTTDASTASWASVDALPAQSGNAGKFLTTDASTASWAEAGGGKIIGYQYSTDTTYREGSAGSEAVTGLTFAYTPSAVTSRLFVTLAFSAKSWGITVSNITLRWRVRTGTTTGGTELFNTHFAMYNGGNPPQTDSFMAGQNYSFIHHPNTTSAQN